MTDTEHRVSKLEDKYHSINTRQESFETFVRAYIDSNEKNISEMKADMREIKAQISNLSSQMHNLIITGAIGIAAIVVAIALK
jgi:predicted  nucleic acid-binding Zn-ribbon protein